ncbi:acyl-CoA N-acyltransferase [Leptodontidium sp. 2 PMI_412]|nr:acyl-CoA N-acyltransferase [Leptodontidium sp. 2 PMI_412]
MPLFLRKATAADAAVLTDIYFSAFSIDAISLLVFPRGPATGSRDFPAWTWWYNSVIEELDSPNAHFICIYDSDSPDQKVVSYAKWNGPNEPFGTDMPVWPEGADIALADHFFGNLVNRHAVIMKGRKHWYLEIIATRPEYQGKGAAGKLLRWGIQKSDEEGTETYLEASPDGKPIYEHLGFREVERLVVELEGKGAGVLAEKEFIEVFMVRPAQKE